MYRWSRVPVVLFGVSLLGSGVALAADQAQVTTATLANGQPLPRIATLPQFSEGGFSGLYPVTGEPNHYWTVSDRGPNGEPIGTPVLRPFPSPAFTPSIYKIAIDPALHEMNIIERVPLKLPAGRVDPLRAVVGGPSNHITGFGNTGVSVAANVPVADEIAVSDSNADSFVNTSDTPFPYDPYGLDTEGIVFDPRDGGSFWLVEEYRPSIIHVALDGTLLQRYTPGGQNAANLGTAWSAVPLSDVLPRAYSMRRDNRGFEGVALSPDGTTLYAVMQNPLAIPNATCSAVPGYAGANNNRSATRIAKVDVTNPAAPVLVGDFIYTLDVAPGTEITYTDLRLSDLFWLGPDTLLVDERDDVGLARRKLYQADLSSATNLLAPGALDTSCVDTLKPSAVAARGIVAATKTPLLDLASTSASPAYPWDKVEGTVRLPSGNFAVINDNDFQTSYNVSTGAFSLSNKIELFAEYGSAAPPVVPETPWVPLLSISGLVVGAAGIGFAQRRRRHAVA